MDKPTMKDLRGAFRAETKRARREIVVPKPKIIAPKPEKKARSKPPKWRTIKCKRCGIEVSTMAKSRKYCPDCAKAAQKEAHRKCVSKPGGQVITGICNSCGREFPYIYRGYDKTLCGECRGANCGAGGPKKIKAKKKKPHVSQIDAIQRAAHAAGMSYGRYVAMMEMQKGA